ncbi:hypothetical protein KQI86_08230 [Clostridium sp. MSJ-11]|uniref:Uncharacterized protein n=1 Tax=Clostridium mobile TaxID=2841512 RepID=A0ABS6EGJ0_9CLOT|nr:hypothetical protein [Clostridium mobile]MBU5484313.1 hypothetical protein [Clostridium mobile]
MNIHNHNLNIHYTAPAEIWDKLNELYFGMPFWNGFVNGCPQWYGNDGKLVEASVEPSGLQFYAKLPQEEWNSWFELFKSRASELLGFQVGEPEDGFEFYIYD